MKGLFLHSKRTIDHPLSSKEHHHCKCGGENDILSRVQVSEGGCDLDRGLLVGTKVLVVLCNLVLLVVEVLDGFVVNQ